MNIIKVYLPRYTTITQSLKTSLLDLQAKITSRIKQKLIFDDSKRNFKLVRDIVTR